MAYWLLKTEPEEFSWDDQVKRGAKGEAWSGVRNFTARRHLKEMKKGEKFFFYHTGDQKQVVGIGEVIGEAFADPQIIARQMRLDLPATGARGGTVPAVRTPILMDGEPFATATAAPRLGEHTDEVLSAVGLGAAEIAALRAKGVVG